MTLWFVFVIMTVAAAALIAAPMLRRFDEERQSVGRDLSVYKDQLEELKREAQDGLIDDGEADLAKVEIQRRMLMAGRNADTEQDQITVAWRQSTAMGIVGIVVLGAVGLYAVTGRPDLAAAKSAKIVASIVPSGTSGQPAAAELPKASQASAPQKAVGDVDEMITRLAERLKLAPNDPDGWRMLGWSQFSRERYKEAAQAYGQAVALKGDSAPLKSAYGEALVRAAGGLVTAEARTVLAGALTLDPSDARARFLTGLGTEQSGDPNGALEIWLTLLKDVSPGDDWAVDLRKRIVELANKTGVDVSARMPKKQATIEIADLNSPKNPTKDEIRNAQKLSPEDRQAMIRGMVDRLDSRLQKSPRDPESWIRLIRSRMVLGEAKRARKALDQALNIFSDDTKVREQLTAAGRQLGVVQN